MQAGSSVKAPTPERKLLADVQTFQEIEAFAARLARVVRLALLPLLLRHTGNLQLIHIVALHSTMASTEASSTPRVELLPGSAHQTCALYPVVRAGSCLFTLCNTAVLSWCSD